VRTTSGLGGTQYDARSRYRFQRYSALEHVSQRVTPLLFVRESKRDDRDGSMPYVFLGPARLVASSGERPMNIEWELEHQMPADVLRIASVVA